MSDKYTITDRVDQGGMAEVFRGVAESIQGFKKSVAIKRILPNLTKNKKFIAMFLDEARVSLNLQHANIVQVFDIGRGADETAYFIVMEYVDGANLKHIVDNHRRKRKPIKISHVIYLMIEVCKGLAYAHDATDPSDGSALGIVHRDVSPPNILVSKNGEVKLVDFGLAKATSQLETTDPGVVKGKFSYLSPEAASGVAVDHRADIFAVGILLWEMLTGHRLFYGETDYQTVELVRQANIPSIAELNPNVEPDLEQVVRKALSRDPADRFQHAADLQDALAHVLFGRGMKVTSRDIAKLVRDAATARAKDKTGPGRGRKESLIDALINDEIARFTSLDEEEQPSALSPEQVGSGDSPLDPGSFIDTRNWMDDFSEDGGDGVLHREEPLPAQRISSQRQAATPPPAPADTDSGNEDEIASLQQILEPTGVHKRVGGARGGVMVAFLVGLVLAGLVLGGYLMFKDQLFPPADRPQGQLETDT